MFELQMEVPVNGVSVHTTINRGRTPEEVAQEAVAKIISISETAEPALKQQAEAFQDRMYHVIVYAIEQGIRSDHTTLINTLTAQGHTDTAELIRKL